MTLILAAEVTLTRNLSEATKNLFGDNRLHRPQQRWPRPKLETQRSTFHHPTSIISPWKTKKANSSICKSPLSPAHPLFLCFPLLVLILHLPTLATSPANVPPPTASLKPKTTPAYKSLLAKWMSPGGIQAKTRSTPYVGLCGLWARGTMRSIGWLKRMDCWRACGVEAVSASCWRACFWQGG